MDMVMESEDRDYYRMVADKCFGMLEIAAERRE